MLVSGGNLTAYEMAGVSSQASKNMREGVRRWEVRGLVDKLHQVSTDRHSTEELWSGMMQPWDGMQ